MNRFYKTISYIFIIFILGFFIAGIAIPDKSFSEMENRYLQEFPKISFKDVLSTKWMNKFEEYISDQFPIRDWFVSLKADITCLLGMKENNGVFNANKGYLIQDLDNLDSDLLLDNINAIRLLKDNLVIDVKSIIVPTAYESLKEYLPEYGYSDSEAAGLDLIDKDLEHINISLTEKIDEMKKDEQIYYKTDHHWTSNLGYEAAAIYLKTLDIDIPDHNELKKNVLTDDFYGTLYSKNPRSDISPDTIYTYNFEPLNETRYMVEYIENGKVVESSDSMFNDKYLDTKDKYGYFLNGNPSLAVIHTDRDTNRSLVMFKDSYSHEMLPYLIPYFDEIHLIDLRYYREDMVEYIKDHEFTHVLFLYNYETFSTDRSISQITSYLENL